MAGSSVEQDGLPAVVLPQCLMEESCWPDDRMFKEVSTSRPGAALPVLWNCTDRAVSEVTLGACVTPCMCVIDDS